MSFADHGIILPEVYEESSNFFCFQCFLLVYINMELSLSVSILQVIQFNNEEHIFVIFYY